MSKVSPSDAGKGNLTISREELGGDFPGAKHEDPVPLIRGRPIFFRSTLFQILVVGLCAFSAPGIWSAMNGLGVGGSQSPDLVNAANALLYAFMTVTCFAGPWLTNIVSFPADKGALD